MPKAANLVFRNSHGELVDLPAVAATRLKSECGAVLDEAVRGGAVVITRHETPRAVLVSYEEFQALVRERAPSLNDLSAEYDVLLARLQTPAAKRGMAAAFDATPANLMPCASVISTPSSPARKSKCQ